jgi:4-hydroxyphenylpyruvate dioxygenase
MTDNKVDFLPLHGTDYIELYVGNAKQAAHFYKTAFGFQSLAYAGPETGVKDRVSYVLIQNKMRLILTTPLHSDSPIALHHLKHGDGVKTFEIWTSDNNDVVGWLTPDEVTQHMLITQSIGRDEEKVGFNR